MKSSAQDPVFVVGMNGSGTTMLADCLNHHPQLYMMPQETLVLPYFISKLDSYGDLSKLPARCRLAAELGKHWAYWQLNGRKPVILDDHMLREPGFSGVLNALYGYFASKEGKTRWCDMTPMYIQHMISLKTHIPNAKFIHIYRDGRDAAQSFHRRFAREPRHTIYRWKKIVKIGREQGRQLGPECYMEVSYEALTTNPEKYMKKICDFLTLRFHPDVLKSRMPYMKGTGFSTDIGTIVRNTQKWRSYFTTKQIIQLESIAGSLLAELDYPVTTTKNDQDPSHWELKWWRIYDRFQDAKETFKNADIRATEYFLRRAKEAILQSRMNKY